MRKWMWIAPLMLLAGCAKSNPPRAAAPAATNIASTPLTQGNPEPVAPPVAATTPAAAAPTTAPVQPPAGEPYAAPTAEDADALPPSQPAPDPAARAEMWVPRGTALRVRIDREVDTRRDRAGARFSATLYEPVRVHGGMVLPVGTRFYGHITESKPSGRLRGRAVLGLTLDAFRLDGREYHIDTSGAYRESRAHKRRNFGFIAGGAGGGAAVGAIAGGGVGAAIGAAAGGGAGLFGAVITGKKQVAVRAEAPFVFTLRAPVRI
jgi:hypothetical protein